MLERIITVVLVVGLSSLCSTTEAMLYFLGFNIAKLFRFYETGQSNIYWVAPANLKEQPMAKLSAKRLSKKGKRQNQKSFG